MNFPQSINRLINSKYWINNKIMKLISVKVLNLVCYEDNNESLHSHQQNYLFMNYLKK